VLSSQIEGTQSSLSDLLLFEVEEAPRVPIEDVVEVSNYVAALEHGLTRLRGGFPLSNRLIREIHGVLLSRGRGSGRSPGESADTRDPRRLALTWARQRQVAGRVPALAELDRRHSAGECAFRSAAAHSGGGLHGRS